MSNSLKLTGTKFSLSADFELGPDQTLRLANSTTVKAYGALGDGITDDTAAIQAAVTAAGSGTLVFEPGATYKITDKINVTQSGLTIIGNGAVLDGSSIATATALSQRFALDVAGTIGDAITVDADVAEGAVTVTVASTSTLATGDLVLLYSNVEKFPAGTSGVNYIGVIHRIRSVDSATQITLFDGAFFAYASASEARIKRIAPIRNVTIENLTVKMGGANKAHCGIGIQYAERCEVRNCTVYDTEDTGVLVGYAYDCDVADCDIYNCTSPGDGSSGVVGNTGYGVCVASAARNVRVLRNRFRNCRHAVAGGGTYTSIAALIQGNVVAGNRSASYGATAALDCHEDTLYWVFDGNHVAGSNASTGTQGILIRGSGTRVVNNVVTGSAAYGIYVRNYDTSSSSRNTVVSGNVITKPRLAGIQVEGSASSLQNEITITNNHVISPADEGIVLFGTTNATVANNVVKVPSAANKSGIRLVGSAASSGLQCRNVAIIGNVVESATAYGIRVDYGDSISINGNQIISSFSHSIYLANSTKAAVSGNKFSTSSASTSGVYMTASTKVAVVGCSGENTATASSQSAGVHIAGASEDVVVAGCVFAAYRYGVYSASPADYISVSGISGRGCTVAAVEISASANTATGANL